MTDTASPADQLRSDVLDELKPHLTIANGNNATAELWHSGGGIIGLKVTVGRSELFTTLEADGDQAFVVADWTTTDGDLIATIEIQVRPHNVADPAAYLAELAGLRLSPRPRG